MNYTQVAAIQARIQMASRPAEAPVEEDSTPVCGWFDSSWALHQGLAVTELPDSDGSVAALWFAALATAAPPTLALQ
jgi:hypothetical protein